jgi:nicotinate-nucleotide adenylyltransferase
MSERVGIYSGSFDPVHNGHIAFCLEAIETCGLSRVLLLPEEHPRYKEGVTPIEQRVAMLRLAAQACPQLEILCLQSRCFTVRETLPEIYAFAPDTELTMLLGSDVAGHMASWPDVETLLKKVSLAIGLRKGISLSETQQIVQTLQEQTKIPVRAQYLVTPKAHAASSRSRALLVHEDNDLDPEVTAYIVKHRLYTRGTVSTEKQMKE